MTETKVFTLALTVDQINTVLAGLGELPHKVSHQVITHIVTSVNQQVSAEPAQAGDTITEPVP